MINELNSQIQSLNIEYQELAAEREKIKKRLYIIDRTVEVIRKTIAKYYEKQINDFIKTNNINATIISFNSLEKITINTDNLLMINSQYPGYSFETKNGYLLSDYYDYNNAIELEKVIKFLKENMKNKTSEIYFPKQDNIS